MTRALTLRSSVPLTGISPQDTCPCRKATHTGLFPRSTAGNKDQGATQRGSAVVGRGGRPAEAWGGGAYTQWEQEDGEAQGRMQNEQEGRKHYRVSICLYLVQRNMEKIKSGYLLGWGNRQEEDCSVVPLPTIRPRFTEYLLWALKSTEDCFPCDGVTIVTSCPILLW